MFQMQIYMCIQLVAMLDLQFSMKVKVKVSIKPFRFDKSFKEKLKSVKNVENPTKVIEYKSTLKLY